ncbi:hypothetical protein HAN_2g218 (nucleomorph) [Hemiselmis andersenii]|uniref:tRNA-intron lyase n=1 Tax=Hemiselmis andersenii TaxID=464988 RepID=A9BKP0_HEMAN|nr:hypothetical protein HAN_2g218 [Hemiselmis andersenii]ABW98045.1 hypothetical protein HAN_2g218 [Hemiselmis andersenii]
MLLMTFEKNFFFKDFFLEKKKPIFKKIPARESNRNHLIHGKFFPENIKIYCKISSYFLLINKLTGFGKGNLSRSEPLFGHPNPSFNSIGRAARENCLNRVILELPWGLEIMEINFIESFFLNKIKILRIQGNFKKKKLKKIFKKIDPFFFWNFLIFQKTRNSLSFVKPGIKYGGNFIIYYGKLSYSDHIHSKSILIVENSNLKEISCVRCSFKKSIDWKNFQNKVRLAQQVSKKVNFIDFFWGKKKNWVLIEINLERFFPK